MPNYTPAQRYSHFWIPPRQITELVSQVESLPIQPTQISPLFKELQHTWHSKNIQEYSVNYRQTGKHRQKQAVIVRRRQKQTGTGECSGRQTYVARAGTGTSTVRYMQAYASTAKHVMTVRQSKNGINQGCFILSLLVVCLPTPDKTDGGGGGSGLFWKTLRVPHKVSNKRADSDTISHASDAIGGNHKTLEATTEGC